MKENNKRIIKNTEIAEAVEAALEERGLEWIDRFSGRHDRIIDAIDIERGPEEEEVPADPSIIQSFILGFIAECEEER